MNRSIIENDCKHIYEQTIDFWKQIENCSFLITGGTGFVGKWLLEAFIFAKNQGHHFNVYVLSRNPTKFKTEHPFLSPTWINFIEGDICNFSFEESKIDYIFHCAGSADTTYNNGHPTETISTTIDGTKHLLSFASSQNIKKIVFFSSGAIYGNQPLDLEKIPENYQGGPDPLDVRSCYGEAKRIAELLLCEWATRESREVSIARGFAFSGPYLPLNGPFAFGNFANNILQNQDITIQGDGTPLRSYLYASDMIIWLINILEKGKNKAAYNLGSSTPLSIEELAQKFKKHAAGISVKVLGTKRAGQKPARYIPSTQKASEELNLKETTSVDEGIKRTLIFYSQED